MKDIYLIAMKEGPAEPLMRGLQKIIESYGGYRILHIEAGAVPPDLIAGQRIIMSYDGCRILQIEAEAVSHDLFAGPANSVVSAYCAKDGALPIKPGDFSSGGGTVTLRDISFGTIDVFSSMQDYFKYRSEEFKMRTKMMVVLINFRKDLPNKQLYHDLGKILGCI